MAKTIYCVWTVLIQTLGGEWIPESMYVVGQTYGGLSAHKKAKKEMEKYWAYMGHEFVKMKYSYLTIPTPKRAQKCESSNTGHYIRPHIGW